jgi:hypothetical protein
MSQTMFAHMSKFFLMKPVESVPGINEWWMKESRQRWIQLWHIWYTVRTFVNTPMYPHPAQLKKRKEKTIAKKDWWSGSSCKPWVQAPVQQKKKSANIQIISIHYQQNWPHWCICHSTHNENIILTFLVYAKHSQR